MKFTLNKRTAFCVQIESLLIILVKEKNSVLFKVLTKLIQQKTVDSRVWWINIIYVPKSNNDHFIFLFQIAFRN